MSNKTQKLYTSRANNLDANTYIGEAGRIFYDEPATTNTAPTLRYSDGVTPGGIPITTGGSISGNIIPSEDDTYSLGSTEYRWKSLHIGPGTLYITDQTLGTNAELTVDKGVLQINGANQLQVGQLKFIDNTIESTTGNVDIQIGLTTSTANIVLNRNVVMGDGKTFTTNSITTADTTTDIILGTDDGSDTGSITAYRTYQLRDGNDNVLMQIQNEDGIGKLKFDGGSNGIWYDGGVVINGVGHSDDYYGIQPMSYNSASGQVTYGQLNYAHFQGFPRLPNFSSDTTANTAIAGQTVGGDFYNTPQRGQMYYNTTTDKAMVYTASGWQAMN